MSSSSSSSSPSAFGALEEPLASVLDFWFGKEDVPRFSIWFQGGESVDQDITRRFKALYEDVVAGKFGEQAHNDAFAALAVIVVLDQFSRNMFRNSPLAFAHDDKSLKLALHGIEKGFDKQLTPLQRSFFYLPLEHSEDKAMHEIAVEKFTALADDLKGTPFEKMGPTFLDYELKYSLSLSLSLPLPVFFSMTNTPPLHTRHKVIIDKFGRYPHRNEVLGRTSTPEELAFLEEDELSQQLSGKRKDK
ncbi:DUF924 domain-containing protein [Balamuthia mandrillaris]